MFRVAQRYSLKGVIGKTERMQQLKTITSGPLHHEYHRSEFASIFYSLARVTRPPTHTMLHKERLFLCVHDAPNVSAHC